MKILLVTHSYGLNGAALLLRDAASHWIKEKKIDLESIKIELPVNGEGASKSEEADDSDKSQEEKDNDLSKLFSSPSPDSNQGDQKK